MIDVTKHYMEGFPCLHVSCGQRPKGVILFYHGWSSNKENQLVRARLLAAYGYDVIIPDAVNHGERGTLDYDSPRLYGSFWKTIFQSYREVTLWLKYIIHWNRRVPKIVMGHSMGAITALGIMTFYDEFCAAVAINGTGWWEEADRHFHEDLNIPPLRTQHALDMNFRVTDPYRHMHLLKGRAILALNGADDKTVNPLSQQGYMQVLATHEEVRSLYKTYDGVGHVVTTNMMGDALEWLDKNIPRY
ncbi:alpha/beta fold hydrolase [uncultured Megasphaera sp.]|uniref:alpha/beta fold hydrolase n=1 Tax=uncultured Megasphaera sp. TaxID=165188 RepID=UPI002593E5C7|nr:alpha/beta fold hydrolase [uncultured Megasphaera sp.]